MPMNEQLSFSVSFGGSVKATASTTIVDTSRPEYEYILVGNSTSSTAITEIDIPTYVLSVNKTTVNEGDAVTFTLTTTMLDVNTPVPYTITGITSADLSSGGLTGNFVINADGTATVTPTLKNDLLTEGTESMTLTLNGKSISKTVTINDTSGTAAYDVGWYSDANGVNVISSTNEGTTTYLVIKTTNVANGTVFNYTISGSGVTSDDIGGALSGNITINNNIGSVTYTTKADRLTEGDESLTVTIKHGTTTVGTANLTINDTSVSTTYQIGVYESTTSVDEISTLGTSAYADATFVVGTFTDSSGDYAGYVPIVRPMGTLIEGKLDDEATLTQCSITKKKPDLLCIIIDAQWNNTPLLNVPLMIKLTNLSTNEAYISNYVVFNETYGWGTWIWIDTVSAVSLVTRIFTKDQRVKLEFLQ